MTISNWESTGKIISDTFLMAKKHKALYLPPVLTLLASVFFVALAIIGIFTISIFTLLLIIPLWVLVDTLLEGTLSWMVYQVKNGKHPSFSEGMRRSTGKIGSLILYTIVSIVVSLVAGSLRRGDNHSFSVQLIKGFFAGALEEAWDIAGHLLLPAIVLTKNTFGEAIKEIPGFVKHLPQVLVGGFAFDFVVGWIYLVEFILSVLFYLIFAGLSETFALVFAICLFITLAICTRILYNFTKSTYFTLLYIEHGMKPVGRVKNAITKKST